MSKLILVFLVAAAAFGCDNISIEDEVEVSIDPTQLPVLIDTVCENGGCGTEGLLTIAVSFDEDSSLQDDTEVEILQYRVDYTLNGVEGEVPYFADAADIYLYVGETVYADIAVAGSRQREFVYQTVGAAGTDGTAKLTLAGYDNFDEQVMIEAEFAVGFGDFYSDSK